MSVGAMRGQKIRFGQDTVVRGSQLLCIGQRLQFLGERGGHDEEPKQEEKYKSFHG